jgi:hypothetical protein
MYNRLIRICIDFRTVDKAQNPSDSETYYYFMYIWFETSDTKFRCLKTSHASSYPLHILQMFAPTATYTSSYERLFASPLFPFTTGFHGLINLFMLTVFELT